MAPPRPPGEDPPDGSDDNADNLSDIQDEYHPLSRQFCALGFQLEGFFEDANEATTHEAPAIIGRVEHLWTRIESTYIQLSEIAPVAVLPTVNSDFRKAQSIYSKTMRLLSSLRPVSTTPSTPQSSSSSASAKPDVKLPRVELPSFGGSITQWPAFSANFKAIMARYPMLTDEEKLTYLKSALKGSAADLVNFIIPGTPDCFATAWKYLEKRFSNKRDIVYDTVRKIINIKNTADHGLEQLIDKFRIALQTLDMMGVQASTAHYVWNPVLIDKLDVATRTAWEQTHMDDSIPSTEMLLDFLQLRARSAPRQQYKSYQPNSGNTSASTSSSTTSQNNQPAAGQSTSTSSNSQKSNKKSTPVPKCPECGLEHYMSKCPVFLQAGMEDKETIVKKYRLCWNCLGTGHSTKNCTSTIKCKTCDKPHHSLLHKPRPAQANLAAFTATVFRPTAIVLAASKPARCIIDAGSTVSFITEKLCHQLNLQKSTVQESIDCLAGLTATTTELVKVPVASLDGNFTCTITAAVVPSITSSSPTEFVKNNFQELKDLVLADPKFNVPAPVELLLGAETIPKYMGNKSVLMKNGPMAQETKLGWIVTGPATALPECQPDDVITDIHQQSNCTNIERFWEVDEPPHVKTLSPEAQKAEEIFEKTTVILPSGRFSVDLPFKGPTPHFGQSRNAAVARFKQLEKRFSRELEFKEAYCNTIQDYLDKKHMVLAPPNPTATKYYLPHHGVFGHSKKLRIVFDGSAKTSTGESLNEEMLNGPTVQSSLFHILMNFRLNEIAIAADVEQMYRQVHVNEGHQDYQRIVWRASPDQPLEDYRLTTVTWGTKAAPFLATRALKEIALKAETLKPEAAHAITNNFYVDDMLTGHSSPKGARKLLYEVKDLLKQYGFNLHKIASNHPGISTVTQDAKVITDQETTALGIKWNLQSDRFTFNHPAIPTRKRLTKRAVLSDAGRIFDPLGWITPISLPAKIFIQHLWQQTEITWDSPLSSAMIQHWQQYVHSLSSLPNLYIDRFSPVTASSTLCCFADASEKAYAAVIYVRTVYNNAVHISLVAAKTRVAPLKKLSLPRLELCALMLLTTLLSLVQEALPFKLRVMAWTDSTVALAWATSSPSRWATFVANRVAEIQNHIPTKCLRHVSSEENPADVASRGCTPAELLTHPLWWKGPPWLMNEDFDQETPLPSTSIEAKKQSALVVSTKPTLPVFAKITSFIQLVRVIALVQKFIALKCKKNVDPERSADDLLYAKHTIFRHVQQNVFQEEFKSLKKTELVKKSSDVAALDPFIDNQGVIRVGGRLKRSTLPPLQAHPVILPRHHRITILYARHIHWWYGHIGPQQLIAQLRQSVWIPAIRNLARIIVKTCVVCTRFRAAGTKQMMADLPKLRVTPARPFSTTGVDMAGPFTLRTHLTRSHREYKAYMAIFVCFVTRAVHIELVSTLSAEGFLAAFQRFISRRGTPHTMYSDRGTNFIAASKELQNLHENKEISNALANQNVRWQFNPAGAPHWGGLWEAGVKSAKYHLVRIIGDTKLNFEEMSTVLCRVEAVLNSRPLTEMTLSPNDEEVLTPAHFLIGTSMTSPTFPESPSGHNQRWTLVQEINNHFWHRWSSEYLTRLQQRPKWLRPQRNIEVGEIVIMKEENVPPLHWRLGRVLQVHTSKDGFVRSVTVKGQHRTFERPVTKICQLPILREPDDVTSAEEPSPKDDEDIDM